MLHEVSFPPRFSRQSVDLSFSCQLTHNLHGPHDERFYKFLAELEDEYDALQRSGYAGEGFFSPGHRLGAGVWHNLPPHPTRVCALEAAERRRMTETMSKSGGRLGGRSSALEKSSPGELAARVSLSFPKFSNVPLTTASPRPLNAESGMRWLAGQGHLHCAKLLRLRKQVRWIR